MKCLDLGTLRALADGELPEDQRREVQLHLEGCKSCWGAMDEMVETKAWASAKLVSLGPDVGPDPNLALLRVRQRMVGERRSVLGWLGFAYARHGSRLVATTAAAVLLALAVALAYPPVWSAAESFLAVFRVQKFEAVSVDASKMPNWPAPTDLGEFKFTREPSIRNNISLDEARKLVDFSLRIPKQVPAGLISTPTVMASGDGEAAFTVNLKKLNEYLAVIGATNVNLPASLDGATIKAKLSPLVALIYSDRALVEMKNQEMVSPPAGMKVVFFVQGRSPVVEAPADVDLEQVRQQILQIPGLPPEFVAQVQAIQDWQQTLLVPVMGGTSRDIKVDGGDGLLITSTQDGMVVVMWQKNGVLYAVGGNLTETEILALANSLG